MKGKVFVDGGARGNPGPAGIGGVIQGPIPVAVWEYLGAATNNVAEYTALIRTVEAGLKKGYSDLDIFADSELMVRQVKGIYKVKNATLKTLFCEAQKQLQQLKKYTITHIPRELNSAADKLVNEAIDHGIS
jgi:ribonuclease HI